MEDKKLKIAAKTLVLHPAFMDDEFNHEFALEEAIGLAHAIELNIDRGLIVPIRDPRPDTLIGGGKVAEIAEYVSNHKIELVYLNSKLTPVQQQNLEKAFNSKVIDRSGLILEIFGARARTSEGKLQVELAALEYQKSRLVRSWTHLERQRGGFGFLGGPGETQIEMDKRMINARMAKIRKLLEKVVKTRELHRKNRQSVPYHIVALVGYTNAGKSTLFNKLTGANVLAEDKLFATLDPTLRMLKLPSGRKVILSDTVGFISNLPHELVAAFRATLEEVVQANILLHVRDISNPESNLQKQNVEEVLKSLGLQTKMANSMFEVYNKIDVAPHVPSGGIGISALNGQGLPELLTWLDSKISSENQTYKIIAKPEDGAKIAWLYRHGHVQERKDTAKRVTMQVNMTEKSYAEFKSKF